MNNAFPYKAWVLMPSFKPVEVEIVDSAAMRETHHISSKGKYYHTTELFNSKVDAIKEGRRLIEVQKADLGKRHGNLMKRIHALDAAE